jgi:hypothetical protein
MFQFRHATEQKIIIPHQSSSFKVQSSLGDMVLPRADGLRMMLQTQVAKFNTREVSCTTR